MRHHDPLQQTITKILSQNRSLETKLKQLHMLEFDIERRYALGTSTVKPVSAMTVDDLIG